MVLPGIRVNLGSSKLFLLCLVIGILVSSGLWQSDVSANSAVRVQESLNTGSTTSVSTNTTNITGGNLVIVICAHRNNSTMSVSAPTGFTAALNQSGTPSQAVFYKIAVAGQNTYTCSFGTSGPVSIRVLEYSGIVTPISGVQASSATGSSANYATGSVTTTTPNRILVGAYIVQNGANAPSWSNDFAAVQYGNVGSGNQNSRFSIGTAEFFATTTGTYGTVATSNANTAWRGQIVSFEAQAGTLTLGIVNSSGVPVASPSFAMSSQSTSFACQTSTGTLGSSTQRLRVQNTTSTPSWSVSLAATGGANARWTSGSNLYHYNTATGSGCTSGQLTVSPSVATISPVGGCTTTGLSLGSNQAFNNPTVNTITLLSASSATNLNCAWDLTGIGLSQTIPAEQRNGTYTLSLTATVVAQ